MRYIKFFAITIAIIAALFSCQKVDELAIDSQVETLTAYAPGSGNVDTPETKVALTEGASGNIEVDWKINDVITIYLDYGERVGDWYVTSIAADGKATFSKLNGENLAQDIDYVAVYPKSDAENIVDWSNEKIEEQIQYSNDDMSHLSENLRMQSDIFQVGDTMNFAHEMAIMSIIYEVNGTFTSNDYCSLYLYDNYGAAAEHSDLLWFKGVSPGDVATLHLVIRPNSRTSARELRIVPNDPESSVEPNKTTTTPFVAGKRYIWDTTSTEPPAPLAGFPSDAVPVAALIKKVGLTTTTISMAIPESGITINNDKGIASLTGSTYFVGYERVGIDPNSTYTKFPTVTWSSSEDGDRIRYIEIISSGVTGGIKLGFAGALPSSKKTVTITATAPNGETKSFDIHLVEQVVTGDAPTSVELDKELFVASPRAEITLTPTILPDATSTDKELEWTSSNTAVAGVTSSGKVTTYSSGTAVITATAAVGGKKATCTVRVGSDNTTGTMYKVGDYYPNATDPIGVVYQVNSMAAGGSASSGKIIALDSFKGTFTTLEENVTVKANNENGYENMRDFYQADNDFSDYPAFKWVSEKNAKDCQYYSGDKSRWYIASEKELRELLAGMCGLVMIGASDPLKDGCINDWSLGYPMRIDELTYTPDLTDFNKKITDKGGQAVSTSINVSSSMSGSYVYGMQPENGHTDIKNTTYPSFEARAIRAF